MKKILFLFIIVFSAAMLWVTACAAVPEVQESTSAVVVSNIADGDFAIAAVYDEYSVLEGVKIYKDKSEVTVDYSKDIFAEYENADYMKLFVWSVNQEPKMTAYGIKLSEKPETDASKTLVAYFSFQGSTKTLAESIEKVTNADIWRIVPEEEYGEENLKYYDESTRSYIEQNNPSTRPKFIGELQNLADYDTIILGYPIWYGKAPRIILTFLETYKDDLKGKTIIPFCTSGSSSISGSLSEIKNAVPDSTVKDGFRGTANMTEDQIKSQLEDNDYEIN